MIKEKLHDTKKNERDLFLTQIAISQKQGIQFESASNVGTAKFQPNITDFKIEDEKKLGRQVADYLSSLYFILFSYISSQKTRRSFCRVALYQEPLTARHVTLLRLLRPKLINS